ncbi:hypothetical protein LTR22_026516 [Elasticomyces elasticus]|nr:hypothetical protein LTR22_026516 [Elasticomyces elasticus]KAK4907948.1 hypothetical protein LTR49_023097 [Elasticomyces elasticus]KAK5748130.1 hypothetical protein LTS12_021822 [Elasticomyces elasticus]
MGSVMLQSEDHRQLLDIIDSLRSRGLSKYVDLPEIAVCGDQSAGKSSVLEAISGMSFPTKDNLCTRFATELILRRDASTKVDVSINAGPDRSESEKERLATVRFEFDITDPDLGAVVEIAKGAMGLSEDKVFSTDTLRIEICGPHQPHLTMVDLPGIFRAGNKDQSLADAATVRCLVEDYMARPRSIILAVVSAKTDFALQEVAELARKLDPKGIRSLGLITKPDTLYAGSESETAYLKLAQNKDVVLNLGWHVMKNRSFETKDISLTERDEQEALLFSKGILRQLPSLRLDIETNLSACEIRLRHLDSPRATPDDQYRYLLRFSHDFSGLIKSALDGMYNHPFFGSAKTDEGYLKRLRAVVQNLLTKFADTMQLKGEARKIIDGPGRVRDLEPNEVARPDYIFEVRELMRVSRGCELPGTFNPLVVGELFSEQCQPWKNHVKETKDCIFEAARSAMVAIVDYIAVEETADGLVRLIGQGMDKLKQDLDRKLDEILRPHFEMHPITYNHYLTDNVQKAQSRRRRRKIETVLRKEFGDLNAQDYNAIEPLHLLNLLDDDIEADMENYGSDLAVDYMEAYYKVALKKFIDDFSVLGIEQCLIQKLPLLFTPEVVQRLTAEEIAGVAAESHAIDIERQQCADRQAALEAGLQDLKVLDKHRPMITEDEFRPHKERPARDTHEDSTADIRQNIRISNDLPEATVEPFVDSWDSLVVGPKRGKKMKGRILQ